MKKATKTATADKPVLSTKPAKTASKLNLATATVATGALPAPKSVYEIMGLTTKMYRTSDYETYQKDLRVMSLSSLHDHAYEIGIGAIENRDLLIDQLERKFISEHGRQGRAKEITQTTPKQELREAALRALAHGR